MMKEKVIVKGKIGLNARPASMFLRLSVKFKSDVMLIKDGNFYNGKSILSILSMGAVNGDEIEIEVLGEDEEEAIKKLVEFFESDLEERYTI
ncbi:MAG: HPr family phosphocarrier protein [Peptoniphilaceae bacterium]|uniref:HPr family phosphocarrier protein n=2 Tax=Parvimonas sp. TaxID=1944660 RepID=UPI002A75E6CB|nr:HPr family phosphocarrier protein [Parvimonas sp.]MDD7764830.1 HPr family phosphocarrier protein [Peptoniphilaceae bacterium]MDY3050163.1 HPr family phosphocarrier protein [Parvimonas sp.]